MNKLINGIKKFYLAASRMNKEFISDFKTCQKEFNGDLKKWLPNIFSTCRIAFTPVISLLFLSGHTIEAGIVAIATCITDRIDGVLARSFNCQSKFGGKLDAIADKLLAASLIFALLPSAPIFFIPLALECGIVSINLIRENKHLNPKTEYIGKIKTVLLDTTLIAGILTPNLTFIKTIIPFMFGSTITLQALTMTKYYKELKKTEKTSIEHNPDLPKIQITNQEKNKEIDNMEYLKNYKDSLEIDEQEKIKTY